ncbi:hypothetical protein RBH26_09590 [Natronolimnohabitans sp. A-GB9]|uniref:hypothetical protein n=1 Tax=Natronolimnohabitans sp. A-GB9 TaxID=3069757 RepID=UPI0027B0EE77|nr:hypothetical protein [Natronolimnohabitans sp. A-GB9]MDQ2050738.1 hypothetical protein [Natronolimnohabitans sp. A-GB9]
MGVVKSHERGGAFISRHFRHHDREDQTEFTTTHGQSTFDDLGSGGKCPGESDVHLKMKSIAYARLKHDFPDATVELESGVDERIADVLLTFDEPCAPYGNGIAIEAQYRNEGKDIDGVTEHYLERGYSVAWLYEDDFSGYDVDLSGLHTVWPCALPDRSGLEGYPDVTRWLRQEKSPSVKLEVPIPGEFWASFDKSGEWVQVAHRYLRRGRFSHSSRAWVTISRSPTGQLTIQIGKKDWGFGGDKHRVTVQLERSDCEELRSFATELEHEGFESEHPSADEREESWYDLTTAWFVGSQNVTSWLSASLSPDDEIVLSLGKKTGGDTDRVSLQIDQTAVGALRSIADLLEQAFELET